MPTDSSAYSLPASLLRQHAFCPRIPFFNEYRGINPGDRPWLPQGADYQKRQEMLSKRRNLERYGLQTGHIRYQVSLASPALGMHGICDAIIETDDALYPVEFKLSATKPVNGHRLQLAAYGLMIEDQFKRPVPEGFILYGRKGSTEKIMIADWQSKVLKARDEIRQNIVRPLLPISSASEAQCGQCEYFNFCADRF